MAALLRLLLAAAAAGLLLPVRCAAEEAASASCSASEASCSASPSGGRSLSYATLPKKLRDTEYAVRGEMVTRSQVLKAQLEQPNHGLPFEELVPCNIGNPQAVGAKPLTFHRQVLSLLGNTLLLDEPGAAKLYPPDVLARAREFSSQGRLGAYSHTKGVELFRRKAAEYVDRRDGSHLAKADVEDIFLTDGASSAVKGVLNAMIEDELDGVLIPIPQYPLYSASLTLLGGTYIGYDMVEDYAEGGGWGIDVGKIEGLIEAFRAKGGRLRALVVINPGNPIGNVMRREDIDAIVRLCEKHRIVILADEVYQENVWHPEREFVSMRRAVLEANSSAELFSFHSMSKGYYGECGLRGGLLHMTNIDPEVVDQIYKLFSLTLCSNTLGQAMMASILTPPEPGQPSHELFAKERAGILAELGRKAKLVEQELDALEGVQCLPVEGAMYAFPMVSMPRRFLAEAGALGKDPDLLYCIKMLEATGVITVPGGGFGQRPGTWHFRMTILPEEQLLRRVMGQIRVFHEAWLKEYLEPGERLAEERSPTPCQPSYPKEVQEGAIEAHIGSVPRGREKPHLLLLFGGSGAGKGTFLRALGRAGLDVHSAFVNHGLDEYIEYLPEYNASKSHPRLVFKDAADGCYKGAIPIAKAAQVELIKRRQNAVYEDTGKDLNRVLKRVLPPFREAGYRVTLALVDNLPAVAQRRAPGRFEKEGRYSSDGYIASTYKNVPENYATLRDTDQVQEAVYCDNSCVGFPAESEQEGGCLKCWLDKGPAGLIPPGALLQGAPERLNHATAA